MNSFNYLIIAGLLLAGCTQTRAPVVPTQPVHPAEHAEVTVALPNIELTEDLLYEYLLTEFASQRGHKALAVEGSDELAKKTHDPRLAKRAAQLALESGNMNRAVDAFRFWQETDPSAVMAARVLSQLLLRGGRLDEARIEFVKVLKSEEPAVGPVFMQLYPMVAGYPDKLAILHMMRDLASPYAGTAEARWVVAQLASAAGDEQLALSEVRQARSLRPEWSAPVSLEAVLLNKLHPQQSLALLSRYLSEYPKSNDIRLQYARALLEEKQYKPAREAFLILARENPGNIELAFAVALISVQLNDLTGAEAELKQALSIGGKGQDAVEYFLGQLNEAKEDEATAVIHYRLVSTGEYQFSARLRLAYLLNKKGLLSEARQAIQQAIAITPAQRVQALVIESQLLSEATQYQEAYRLLTQGLVNMPDQPDLLYEAAMLADKIGNYEESEKLLRKLILIRPTHAHAYNALGYSLLERNVRVAEAVLLVERALALTPDDHAIMDSVGWGYYRSGRLDESVAMLRRAFAGNPDPEIAAHLGEVLWIRGDKTEAEKIWQDSLKAHPGNVPLQAVMKRYLP